MKHARVYLMKSNASGILPEFGIVKLSFGVCSALENFLLSQDAMRTLSLWMAVTMTSFERCSGHTSYNHFTTSTCPSSAAHCMENFEPFCVRLVCNHFTARNALQLSKYLVMSIPGVCGGSEVVRNAVLQKTSWGDASYLSNDSGVDFARRPG